MRTITKATADVLLAERPDLRVKIDRCGQMVGSRIEVDLDQVERIDPELATALGSYQEATLSLWEAVRTGAGAGLPFQVTRRTLADHRQVTGKGGRCDLNEVFTLLSHLPGVCDVLSELTNPAVDASALKATLDNVGGDVLQGGAGADGWAVQVMLDGVHHWPAELGGAPALTEVSRRLVLHVRHAAWRDRRVRRLASVRVKVDELWADPTECRANLPAA